MKPRILIVGTVPFNKRSTSRAFESYFSNWEKKNLAQIFSNTKQPAKGHCETLFQITDQRLLRRRINRSLDTGLVFNDKDLPCEWNDNNLEVNSSFFEKLYGIGKKKMPLTYILRKYIWKKRYWCTEKLNQWLDDFKPDCVFLSFSDDFFIQEIALYVAERYNIPIVSSIGDDYYFDFKLSFSPFYYVYKLWYRKLIQKVFKHEGSAIFIGDKIRDKYNFHFGLDGKTVYLASTIHRKEFKEIDSEYPKIIYCGNIRLGRNTSLNDIGYSLGKINPNYVLDIYSNENDSKYYKLFEKNNNIKFHGSIPYSEVQEEIIGSDIVIIVEGFKDSEVRISRYSLSTKVADSLASGSHILAYGSIECGAIEYIKSTTGASVCEKKENLVGCITNLIENIEYQRKNYDITARIMQQNHNLELSSSIFDDVVNSLIKRRCEDA